jgi:hypothetical protein
VDEFRYQLRQSYYTSFDAATVTINVTSEGNRPLAVNDSYTTGGQIFGPLVKVNDSDPDGDRLTLLLVDSPAGGNVTLYNQAHFIYEPENGFLGTISFTYRVHDGQLSSNVATVTIRVATANQPPVSINDSYTTPEDTPLAISLPGILANDTDPEGDTLDLSFAGGGGNGTISRNSDGSFVYLPNKNFHGADFLGTIHTMARPTASMPRLPSRSRRSTTRR